MTDYGVEVLYGICVAALALTCLALLICFVCYQRYPDPKIETETEEIPEGGVEAEKGETFRLNPKCAQYTVGLGWKSSVDVDSGVVMVSKGKVVDVVSFQKLKSNDGAVVHKGDTLSGGGEGDLETITVELRKVEAHIDSLYIGVTIYRGYGVEHTFESVAECYCRLLDDQAAQKVRYELQGDPQMGKSSGMLMACIARNGEDWNLQLLGQAVVGPTGLVGYMTEAVLELEHARVGKFATPSVVFSNLMPKNERKAIKDAQAAESTAGDTTDDEDASDEDASELPEDESSEDA